MYGKPEAIGSGQGKGVAIKLAVNAGEYRPCLLGSGWLMPATSYPGLSMIPK